MSVGQAWARPAPRPPGPLGRLQEKLLALLGGDAFLNGLMALAITVGFFHGWLKLRFHHPAVTFLFDGMLLGLVGLVYLRKDRKGPFFPAGPVRSALLLFYAVCAVYAVLPLGPPWLVSVAALRGWCFPPLIYGLGFHITHSLDQIKGYLYFLIILGVLTGVYGLRQSPEEIEQRILQNEVIARRLMNTYYSTQDGRNQMRLFSTFVSAAAFGTTMVFVSMFAIALISEKEAPRLERGLLGLALLPMTYAVVLSGSRSPLIMLGVGLLIIAWYRREVLSFVVIPGALYAAFKWAASFTKGAATERFSTLLQQTTIWDRFYIPMLFTWYVFLQNPWGGGLGKSGYSLPFVFRDQAGYDDFKMGEGDLSCLAIEMGVVGLGVFLWLLYEASRLILESLSRLRGTPAFTLALASATAMSTAVICFPIGSPFLGIPTGALTWFFLGTLHKVSLQYQTTAKPCAPAVPRPRPVAQVRHAAAPEPPRARPPRRPKLLP